MWNMETVRHGYLHGCVRGAIHAIRQRDNTLSEQTRKARAIPRLLRLYQEAQPPFIRVCNSKDGMVNRVSNVKQSVSGESSITLQGVKNIFLELSEFSAILESLSEVPQFERKEIVESIFCHLREGELAKKIVWCAEDITDDALLLFYLLSSQKFDCDNLLIICTGTIESNIQFEGVLRLSDYTCGFHRSAWPEVLHTIVGEICPKGLVNYNSNVCAEMYQRYGRPLKLHCKLYSVIAKSESDRLTNFMSYLNRIRSALNLGVEIIAATPKCQLDLDCARAVNWSVFPRPDFWMNNQLILNVKAHTIYSIDVYLPKISESQHKDIVVRSIEQEEEESAIYALYCVERGRCTTITISPKAQSVDLVYAIECEAERGVNAQFALGFVLVNEVIERRAQVQDMAAA